MLVEKAVELLTGEGIDFSTEDIMRLMQYAPNIKDMFVKVTGTSVDSSQNVFDILKQGISVYQDELKIEDLTSEQREDITTEWTNMRCMHENKMRVINTS